MYLFLGFVAGFGDDFSADYEKILKKLGTNVTSLTLFFIEIFYWKASFFTYTSEYYN